MAPAKRTAPALPVFWLAETRAGTAELAAAIGAYRAGVTARAAGAQVGIGKTAMLRVLRDAGVTIRSQGLANEDIERAAQLYADGSLLREVAEHFDVSTECVRQALLRHGVVMRVGVGARDGSRRRR